MGMAPADATSSCSQVWVARLAKKAQPLYCTSDDAVCLPMPCKTRCTPSKLKIIVLAALPAARCVNVPEQWPCTPGSSGCMSIASSTAWIPLFEATKSLLSSSVIKLRSASQPCSKAKGTSLFEPITCRIWYTKDLTFGPSSSCSSSSLSVYKSLKLSAMSSGPMGKLPKTSSKSSSSPSASESRTRSHWRSAESACLSSMPTSGNPPSTLRNSRRHMERPMPKVGSGSKYWKRCIFASALCRRASEPTSKPLSTAVICQESPPSSSP
mmetsp:Transcript_40074/g.101821  ORF Transcript_40074/g.101821 Transcript_40074/m.101821 type:complete len:268 (-) Transcript_40074:986-1789(-)